MKKLLALLLVLTFSVTLLFSASCKDKGVKKEYENVKTELDKIKGHHEESNVAIDKLRNEIKALEIEKQRLIAEKKRLEAEIIELKIKDYEQTADAKDTNDKKN